MQHLTLRSDQRIWVEQLRAHYSQGSRWPLGQAPTGFGKTVCISFICDGVSRKGNRPCVLVHRQELIVQTSVALARMGVWHHIIAPADVIRAAIKAQLEVVGRSFYNAEAGTGLASVQTLARRIRAVGFTPYDFLLVDEGHHAVAGQWGQIIAAHPNAWGLGVTATPERLDGKGLGVQCGGVYTSMVIGPSVQELIANGYLARPRVYAPPIQLDLKGIRQSGGDFERGETARRLDKPSITGDVIGHYARICPGIPAIAFCASVLHAEHVAEQFNAAGWRAASVDGNTDDATRRGRIRALGEGRLDVLTSCDIISEGTDVPIVGAAILLRPTKSLAMYLQQVGRALRRYPGKDCAFIIDHVGNSDDERHGLPDEHREWSLLGRAQRKRGGGGETAPRLCRECYAMYPAYRSACPECGTEPETVDRMELIKHREGELIEVQRRAAAADRRREQGMAKSREDLIAVGQRRGVANPEAWADFVLRGRGQQAKVPNPSEEGTLL